MKTALVLGAGGFIGSHLVRRLKSEGFWVRGVDRKYPEFSRSAADEFVLADLKNPALVQKIWISGADIGGLGSWAGCSERDRTGPDRCVRGVGRPLT